MKKLSNLKGAKALSKKEQKQIHGGIVDGPWIFNAFYDDGPISTCDDISCPETWVNPQGGNLCIVTCEQGASGAYCLYDPC